MKKFMVYMDDGRHCFKVPVPAETEEEAREYVDGNGEVVAVKDVTKEFPIDSEKVRMALLRAEFGEIETHFIQRALDRIGITEY